MSFKDASRASHAEAQARPMFARFARWVERQVGRSSTFVIAIAVVIVWAASGPIFGWSDTWQLVINTGTTIVTFLMVFVIQNTQTRDTQAIQLKLDELIRVSEKARNSCRMRKKSRECGKILGCNRPCLRDVGGHRCVVGTGTRGRCSVT